MAAALLQQPQQKRGFPIYTFLRVSTQSMTLFLLAYFIYMQTKWPGYFLGAILYLTLGVANFVFFCLSHPTKLQILSNIIFWLIWGGLTLGAFIWHLVYIIKQY